MYMIMYVQLARSILPVQGKETQEADHRRHCHRRDFQTVPFDNGKVLI